MAISNLSRDVSLTTEILNLPVSAGISVGGYWYYYVPAAANNAVLGAYIKPYRWGTALPLVGSVANLQMDGTFSYVQETWEGSAKTYHGGTIEWIGPGTNDITNTPETDAFFFAHVGSLAGTLDDDAYYWDRCYLAEGSSEWDYYQYHKHVPSFYVQYENGRLVTSGDGFIVPEDQTFAYMISNRVSVMGTDYTSVMVRVHTPSIGGAHNSHNDTNLPATSGKNYLQSGICRGNSNRFHAFYISANSTQWDVFTRTYTDASKSFTGEVYLGTYDLADPTFTPGSNTQSQYPIRASCGTVFGPRIYIPVIKNNPTSGFDLKFWSYNSLDTIAGGSFLEFQVPDQTGLGVRPDAQVVTVGDKIYSLITDVTNGGAKIYSYDGTTITDEGSVVTNANTNFIRVHGFKYNSTDAKFYALLSGTAGGTGTTYLGPGIYSFTISGSYTGYRHLDYSAANNTFVDRAPLANGYIQYNQLDGTMVRSNNQEPEGIASGTNILEYTTASPKFFDRRQIDISEEYYYRGIILKDGRKCLSGRIEGDINNAGRSDFLLSFIGEVSDKGTHSSNTIQHHFTWGGAGDDYLTGMIQSTSNSQNLWLTGYTKSELVDKKDVKLHGFCRNLNDGSNAMRWVDIATDSAGNICVVGNHTTDNYIVAAKYDYNYNLLWQRTLDAGANTNGDVAYGLALDSSDNIYIAGKTSNAGEGSTDALLIKLNSSGVTVLNKLYGTSGSETATSVCVINKSGTEYIVLPVVTGANTTFLIANTSGSSLEQCTVQNLNVNRVRAQQSTPTGGRFLFAGNDGAGGTKAAKFGMCEVDNVTRMVQWTSTYAGGATPSDAYDMQNIDAAVGGNGAGYIIAGSDGTNGLTLKVSVDESGGSYTVTKSWARNLVTSTMYSIAVSPYTDATRYATVVGYTTASGIADMGLDDCIIVQYNGAGTIQWQNAFGHDADERFLGLVNDITGENVIAAGWSTSHSLGTDAIIFRLPNSGFATGKYHLADNAGQGYFYNKTTKSEASNSNSLTNLTAPSDIVGALVTGSIATNNLVNTAGVFQDFTYDGSYGPNGVFMLFVAKVDLNAVQTRLNTINNDSNHFITLDHTDSIFTFWQVAVPGDGTADDGNIFGYDLIEASDGALYIAAQTSGDVGRTNSGTAGAYDYMLVEFDPATEVFEYYQNGTAQDEEIYALTELSNGKIAYTGRTIGTLGGANIGGYDIFLGIFDPNTETSTYYSTGSGFDDKGFGVHDLGSNTLAVAYSTFGGFGDSTSSGSEDIGIIKFNYDTGTWGNNYQTGSSTSELIIQNGKQSTLMGDGRIAIVCHTAGIFADDSTTYGFLDLALGIINPTTGLWKKYQIGSGASEFATSVYNAGTKLLIAGYSEATFDSDSHGIWVEFDTLNTVAAKSAAAFT